MRAIDLTGQKFGKLTAIEVVETGRRRKWRCVCDCGRETAVSSDSLRSGNTKACGHCRGPNQSAKKHGHRPQGARGGAYSSWGSMKTRCSNSNSDSFADYGARGIAYDPRWESFEAFLADMGERPKGTTLDRIDGTKGYSKSNCRWATPIEQTRNRRNARTFEYRGERLAVLEWAHRYGLTYASAYNRLARGQPLGKENEC